MTGIALITGGQQGIGLGIATALVQAGFKVALAAELPAHAPSVQNALADLGAAAHYFQHDLRDIGACPALLDAVEVGLGPITTLVSNAGVPARLRGDLLDLGPESYDTVMAVNLRGAFFLAQAVARRMVARPSAIYRSISFITSVSASMVSIERGEYCMSKAGASMMAQLFAARLAPEAIGVFELRPGIVATDMTAGVRDKYTARIESGLVPAARWGEPRDIGQIIVPIATGQLAFATGAIIPVDGGLSIPRL
jgi:NAD(P)-dependent dehydrogenase (short-subunit alcohol dehydrogenase family)